MPVKISSERERGRMKTSLKKELQKLEEIAEKGVLFYHNERRVQPWDIVKEEMSYHPEFIVVDENGKLQEIWY